MTTVVLFHHAQGLTDGVVALADTLRTAGHDVRTPDLYDGHTYATLEDGLAHAERLGFENIARLGAQALGVVPADAVFVGLSLGVMPAQLLTQTTPDARGGVFVGSCVPPEFFGAWPDGRRAQVHGMDHDPIFAGEGDLDAARDLVAAHPEVELYLYPGDKHLFMDSSLPDHDGPAEELLTARVLAFLAEEA